MRTQGSVVVSIALCLAAALPTAAADRVLRATVTVPAPIEAVWKAWTTAEGIESFFAPKGAVELRVDGTYDVWFNPAGAPGERGAEGMRILDVDPPRRFAFTWSAPPAIPAIRGKFSVVVIDLAPAEGQATRLTLTHSAWGEGPDWDRAYEYFDRAWGAVVLPRLVHRFAKGPLDWSAPPALEPVADSLKVTLVERAP